MYRRAESPRPMPITMRPSEMSCSVAYPLASTVGSRVPGFVTQCPNFIVEVACTAIVSSGNDSCQSTCESYVQPYWKPLFSACRMSSRKREYGGSGRTVTPKLRAISVSPSLGRKARLSSLDACGAERYQRRCGKHGDRGERDPPVARELEREAGERRPDEDGEDRAGVDERDRGAGCVRPLALGCGEDHGER